MACWHAFRARGTYDHRHISANVPQSVEFVSHGRWTLVGNAAVIEAGYGS
jgi:hypothetical protein